MTDKIWIDIVGMKKKLIGMQYHNSTSLTNHDNDFIGKLIREAFEKGCDSVVIWRVNRK